MPSSFVAPLRSWRTVVVLACLGGATLVCGALAFAVRNANAALELVAGDALHNYAAAAGQGLSAELLRRTTEFRMKLFAPIAPVPGVVTPTPTLERFAEHADSLYAAERYGRDPLRGYLRLELATGHWVAAGALTDSAFGHMLVDTLTARLAGSMVAQSGLITTPWRGSTMSATYIPFADRSTHKAYFYVVTQTRALAIRRPMNDALATTLLLPPSVTEYVWRAGVTPSISEANAALIGVRVIGGDGSQLYASPHWFSSPYRATYAFQAGPGGFKIETVLPRGLEAKLVPPAVRSAGRSLYLGLGLVGAFLLVVSGVAFWGELAHQRKARTQSMTQLTTGLRHELNNALASVLLEAQMLATAPDASTDARQAGSAIAEQAERMRNVLRRLDHVEQLPVVDYFEGKSMVDLAETGELPVLGARR